MTTPRPRIIERTPGRRVAIDGGLSVLRRLPSRRRRTIGPWCFADDYGPIAPTPGPTMSVGPHPHIGLATLTYLLDGVVTHRDGLGTAARVSARESALMIAGRGIVHAEHADEDVGQLRGLQLWIALPDAQRNCSPSFVHQQELPVLERDGFTIRVVLGELAGTVSPTPWPSAIVAAEIGSRVGGTIELPLDSECEHGLWPLDGSIEIDGLPLAQNDLAYIPPRSSSLSVTANGAASCWLIGGAPFSEAILMWWNFVARTFEEIVEARSRWENGEFPPVLNSPDPLVPAPALPVGRLRARS